MLNGEVSDILDRDLDIRFRGEIPSAWGVGEIFDGSEGI